MFKTVAGNLTIRARGDEVPIVGELRIFIFYAFKDAAYMLSTDGIECIFEVKYKGEMTSVIDNANAYGG
jgi:hypothetical protein